MQDSGLGSRSSPGFNTLPVRLLVVSLSKSLHAALLLSTQEEMGTCEGRFVSRGAKFRVSGCILSRELRWLSRRIWTVKAQWPGKVLVKVYRAELWAWMWTQNSDFTLLYLLMIFCQHLSPYLHSVVVYHYVISLLMQMPLLACNSPLSSLAFAFVCIQRQTHLRFINILGALVPNKWHGATPTLKYTYCFIYSVHHTDSVVTTSNKRSKEIN